MKALRRLVGAIAALISAIGIVVCAAGIAGVWIGHQRITDKARTITAKFDGGLERVSVANQNVRRAADRARADVALVRKESADLNGDHETRRRAARTIGTLIQQRVGPAVDEFGGRLATVSDTAAAAASLLETLQEAPLGQLPLFDPDQLTQRASEVQRLSAILRRLELAVADGDSNTASREVVDATGEVDLVLQKCQATIEEWQSGLDTTRERLAQFERKVIAYLTLVAIAVTALVAWVAAGQVSLLVHAVKWLRGP
jgi:hypothetical protein